MTEIVNFDELYPEKRIAILGGKEIDVSIIPAKITLKYLSLIDKKRAIIKEKLEKGHKGKKKEFKDEDIPDEVLADSFNEDDLDEIIDIVSLVCEPSAPEYTSDWLLSKVPLLVLNKFCSFVMKPMVDELHQKTEEAEEKETEVVEEGN